MGVASGCGYIDFLILLIPVYSSCICYFLQQHLYFLFIFKYVFRSCQSLIKLHNHSIVCAHIYIVDMRTKEVSKCAVTSERSVFS